MKEIVAQYAHEYSRIKIELHREFNKMCRSMQKVDCIKEFDFSIMQSNTKDQATPNP